MTLRPYQQRAIDETYQYLSGHAGNPCVVLPTGSGKSVVIAEICRHAVQTWPGTEILMLTHVKELIQQNYEKLKIVWPFAPAGIYSAGLKRKESHFPITFGGIQSLRDKADEVGRVDLVLIDEAHLVSHKDEGGYRKLMNALKIINPAMRVIGFTATPYRMGHGLITDGSALFDDLIEPVTIEELVYQGYLSRPVSKATRDRLSVDGVRKRGGEYIESELQAAVDTDDHNAAIVREVIETAGDRKAWLFFCAGVDHAYHVRDCLIAEGVSSATITGRTAPTERDEIIQRYKAGEIRALTNANVLTTGFDYPGIDLIAMLRPTMSPGLYMQMVGRGMRVAEGKKDCLVLDFAGVVAQHGPITNVVTPSKPGEGVAPAKECPECGYIIHAAARACEFCGHEFPPPEKDPMYRRDDEVFENTLREMDVDYWVWEVATSRKSGKRMIVCRYYSPALNEKGISEYYLILEHEGFAYQKSMKEIARTTAEAGIDVDDYDTPEAFCAAMNQALAPEKIVYKMDGRYPRIVDKVWPPKEEKKYDDEIPF